MEKLVNEELLNITLANMFSSKRREQELFMIISSLAAEVAAYERSIKTLENHMTSELASEIKALKSNLEIRKEKEKVLVNEIDSLKAKLNERLLKVCSSCSDLMCVNGLKSGVYVVKNNVQVYCDQTTGDGGWTVFQRRKDGSVDFERNWTDYKAGFGDLEGEFWLGNDNIHKLTATGNHELRVDMADFEGNKAYAKYSNFRKKSESDNYAIEVSGYSGDSGDSLTYHNGMAFSTKDRDNDERLGSCSKSYRVAWWYGKGCHNSNLNGFYYNGANSPHGKGIVWYHWKKTHTYSLKYVKMKFR